MCREGSREIDLPIPEGIVAAFHRPGTLAAVAPRVRMQAWVNNDGVSVVTHVIEANRLIAFHDTSFRSWRGLFKAIDLRRAQGIPTIEGRE